MRQGRVIRIFDDRKIAIDLGAVDGATAEMSFGVFTPSDSIIDPQTGEDLGTYRERKATLEVDEIHERFTIARPLMRRVREPDPDPPLPIGVPQILMPRSRARTRYERTRLTIDETQAQPLPTGSEIQLNDIVESLSDPPSGEDLSEAERDGAER